MKLAANAPPVETAGHRRQHAGFWNYWLAPREPALRDLIEDEEITEAVSIIRDAGTMFDDPADPPAVLRDSTDDYLVALAREADAEAIVTSDRDLLDHDDLKPSAIDPRTACELLALID
jgi:uncharacterized protein